MKTRIYLSILSIALLISGLYASEQTSVAISPGRVGGIAVINEVCPTFSWTALEGAVSYRLEVFEAQSDSHLPYREMAGSAPPILIKEMQGTATSWTPSSGERLYDGATFIWYVQATDPYGYGDWSEGKLFQVETNIWPAGIDDKLSETLKEYGVSEEIVSEALEDIKTDVMTGMTGKAAKQDNHPSSPQNKMKTSAYEQWDNTLYGYYTGNFLTTGKYNALFGSYAGQLLSTGSENVVIGHDAANSISSGFRNAFLGYRSGYMNSSGYQNTFLGHKSGLSNSDGIDNVFVGDRAGQSNASGSNNVFIGATAGNFANTTTGNVFIGYAAGYWNGSASGNCFIGYQSGFSNTNTGIGNTFTGYYTGRENISGSGNSFYGHYSGASNTTGYHNTYIGSGAGRSNTTGYQNTFVGYGAGHTNDIGMGNVFLGFGAGYWNTSGGGNNFIGYNAGVLNTTGTGNTFNGYNSGNSNTTGNGNTFSGYSAGNSNTVGSQNTFVGNGAGFSNLDSQYNTFVGSSAGFNNLARSNTFIGYYAGYSNTEGSQNTFLGYRAGEANTSAGGNTFLGNHAGEDNDGNYNTFVGDQAGIDCTNGIMNVFVGHLAGAHTGSDSRNTFLGYHAGLRSNGGGGNVFLGYKSGSSETGSNKLCIDNSDTTDPLIYGEFDNNILGFMGSVGVGTKSPAFPMEMKKTGTNASIVVDRTDGATNYINATSTAGNFGTVTNHVLRLIVGSQWRMRIHTDNSLTLRNGASCTTAGVWTNASSRELKDDINDLTVEQALDALNDLQPVTYKYKADRDDEHVGFIAEDVPDLVASKDRKGMSPMDVVAVLTKVLQEQQKVIDELKNEVEKMKKQ